MEKVNVKYITLICIVLIQALIISSCGTTQKTLTDKAVKEKIKDYVMEQFETILKNETLEISDITVHPDRVKSDSDKNVYNVYGVVKNLKLEDRTLEYARFNFTFVLNTKNLSISKSTTKIVVMVDDDLSPSKIELIINESIKKAYGEPLYIKHEKDNNYIYGADVKTIVKSTITLEKFIVYTETHFIFEEKIDNEYPTFIVKAGNWVIQEMNEIWKAEMPNESNIRQNSELNNLIYTHLNNQISESEGKANFKKDFLFFNLSKIESVYKIEPIEANKQVCKFSIELYYKMARLDFWKGNKKFKVNLNAILKYDEDKNIWEYYSNPDIINSQIINEPDKNLIEKIAVPAIALTVIIILVVILKGKST